MGLQGITTRGIIGRFFQTLEQNLGQTWIPGVSMLFPSDQEIETYKWLGFSPALREWIGGRNAKGLRENGITIENKKYEATLEVDANDRRRDKTGQLQIRIDEMADRVNAHWAKLLTTLIINAETQTCYDGQAFFDTDHQEGDSPQQSNDLAASDYSELNVSDPTNPTAYELSLVILKMIQHMYSIKDDQGEPMNELARNFIVMVPVQFWGSAQQAVTSGLLNTGAGSIENPLRNANQTITVTANPRLTWTSKLAMFRTDGRAKPFIRQEEVGIQMKAIAEGSEEEFHNDRHLFGVKSIRNVGYGYWQHANIATLS